MPQPFDSARQLPFDLAHRAGQGRDDLVSGTSNAAAVGLIDRWPDWPSAVVVLAGPAGSGKSHLAAIWRETSGAASFAPGDIPPEAIEAAAQGFVLIDDIDGAPIDERGLFHLVNAARASDTHLLLTSRRFPLSWGVKLPDLVSRLRTAAIVEILEPDDTLLAGVITKLFADRQVEVEPHVVQYIVRRMERSLASANDLVERLDRAALEQKSRISRAFAAEVMTARDMGQGELDL